MRSCTRRFVDNVNEREVPPTASLLVFRPSHGSEKAEASELADGDWHESPSMPQDALASEWGL